MGSNHGNKEYSRILSSETSFQLKNLNSQQIPQQQELSPKEWDLIILYKTDSESQIGYEDLIDRLSIALETYSFYSTDKLETFIKVRASIDKLREHACDIDYPLLLDENYLRNNIDDPQEPILDDPIQTHLHPYQYIHAPFDDEKPREMFAKTCDGTHPFTPIIRMNLVLSMIESPKVCGLSLKKLNLEVYPLHNRPVRDSLFRHWLHWRTMPWEQPLDDLRDYLGEKMAVYFAFLGHYATWLAPLGVAGVIVSIVVLAQEQQYRSLGKSLSRDALVPFFAAFVSFWSTFMLEFWTRKEVTLAMKWGQTSFEEQEKERPDFYSDSPKKNDTRPSIITGKPEKFFPAQKRFWLLAYSYMVIGGMMLLVVGVVTGIFGLGYYMEAVSSSPSLNANGSSVASILSAVQITVLGSIYTDLAHRLTEQENHRTQTQFEDSLIGKLFAFNFVNSYASFYYIAFVQRHLMPCSGSCMLLLAKQLAIVFGSAIVIKNVQSYLTLKITVWAREKQEKKELSEAREKRGDPNLHFSAAEEDMILIPYDPSLGLIEDFNEVAIQFGFVTMFVAACPLAPLLAFVSNWFEIRNDGWRLLYMNRRVFPLGGEDIGTWFTIFRIISYFSVLTNAGIVCFTMQVLPLPEGGSFWVFLGFQYFVIVVMTAFSYLIPDIPEDTRIQLERQTYLADLAGLSPEERQARKGHDHHEQGETHTALSAYLIHEYDMGMETKNKSTNPLVGI